MRPVLLIGAVCLVSALLVGALVVDGMTIDSSRHPTALPPLASPATSIEYYAASAIDAPPRSTPTTTTTLTTSAPKKVVDDVWDRLAQCESNSRWHIHDSIHEGGLQFAVSTWDAYKLPGDPEGAHQATREQQIAVAIRVRDGVPGTRDPYLNAQGWGAWPTCSRIIGLRP